MCLTLRPTFRFIKRFAPPGLLVYLQAERTDRLGLFRAADILLDTSAKDLLGIRMMGDAGSFSQTYFVRFQPDFIQVFLYNRRIRKYNHCQTQHLDSGFGCHLDT